MWQRELLFGGSTLLCFILILYKWFSCKKNINLANGGLSGLALKSNSSICLVLTPHRQLENYSLSTGENYGLTVQHMQDCPIFFIQLSYVYKSKINKIGSCHLNINSPATRWHWDSTSYFSIQPFCIAAILVTTVYIC